MGKKAVDGKVPFRTWYSRRAAVIPESAATIWPEGVARNFMNAALEGARMVMFWALPSVVRRAGCLARSSGGLLALLLTKLNI